ncbi:hypothetical protein OGAPHI_000062 [Ogataea philodendri]|uniref:Uncharacterized protein n=1 Tax=Ogataea philodendri TaxID=1378263 RepID=A0A9P8PH44_9ASCO|nr:uncharacterized protein OGAPHI_000062 [Ogataea philodendri]KAH3671876.1 hypothetical protein OGAPHI_000062 [Ogataea philodendri]
MEQKMKIITKIPFPGLAKVEAGWPVATMFIRFNSRSTHPSREMIWKRVDKELDIPSKLRVGFEYDLGDTMSHLNTVLVYSMVHSALVDSPSVQTASLPTKRCSPQIENGSRTLMEIKTAASILRAPEMTA